MFAASSSFLGKTIACSYRPEEKTRRKDMIDTKKAKAPNSSGEKIRVNIGVKAKGISCAIVVPVMRATTFFPKSDSTISLIFFRINFNLVYSKQVPNFLLMINIVKGTAYK